MKPKFKLFDMIITIVAFILSPIFYLIAFIYTPKNQIFCRHNWETKIYPATMGVFGGMKHYICKKCGKEKVWDEAIKRLERNCLL